MKLTSLVGLKSGIYLLIEGKNNLFQEWLRTIVVGIGHKLDQLVVNVPGDFKGSSATNTLAQMVGEIVAILLDHTFFDDIRTHIRERLQEIRGFLVKSDHHRLGIRCQDAIPNNGLHL